MSNGWNDGPEAFAHRAAAMAHDLAAEALTTLSLAREAAEKACSDAIGASGDAESNGPIACATGRAGTAEDEQVAYRAHRDAAAQHRNASGRIALGGAT